MSVANLVRRQFRTEFANDVVLDLPLRIQGAQSKIAIFRFTGGISRITREGDTERFVGKFRHVLSIEWRDFRRQRC